MALYKNVNWKIKLRLDMEPRENENIHPPPELEGKPGSTMCYHRSFHLKCSLWCSVFFLLLFLKSNYQKKPFQSVQPVVKFTSTRSLLCNWKIKLYRRYTHKYTNTNCMFKFTDAVCPSSSDNNGSVIIPHYCVRIASIFVGTDLSFKPWEWGLLQSG